MKITYRVNEQIIDLCPQSDDEEGCNNLKGNNVCTYNLLKQLAEEGQIIVTQPITRITRFISESEEELVYDSEEAATQPIPDTGNEGCSENLWTDSQTRLVLDCYHNYMDKIGPMKKFKTKKIMWAQISKDLYNELKVTKTPLQIENRYKTIIRKKKTAVENNSKSGNSREQIEFESELNKISALDDSIEPEVIRSSKGVKLLKRKCVEDNSDEEKENSPTKNVLKIKKRNKSSNIVETLQRLQDVKEEAKEKRHNEKLQMIRELVGKNN